MSTVDIRNMTRRPAPRFPYMALAEAALPGWELSLVYVGKAKAISTNKALRRKSYAPNVLSYETGKRSGEILICLEVAEKQAAEYQMTYPQFVAFLFIHALMHLKGYPHGPTMENKERALFARFITNRISNGSTNRNRNRHRNSPDESRRR